VRTARTTHLTGPDGLEAMRRYLAAVERGAGLQTRIAAQEDAVDFPGDSEILEVRIEWSERPGPASEGPEDWGSEEEAAESGKDLPGGLLNRRVALYDRTLALLARHPDVFAGAGSARG
jgi:hypothetical protein